MCVVMWASFLRLGDVGGVAPAVAGALEIAGDAVRGVVDRGGVSAGAGKEMKRAKVLDAGLRRLGTNARAEGGRVGRARAQREAEVALMSGDGGPGAAPLIGQRVDFRRDLTQDFR
ncbi:MULTISPECIES: hypothetical protein [unclassified Methylosinus]|uniref:hypothetical protein n=1 Tax=unclassified Methylosinus TaxID=2624500 RepID=UPI0012EE2A76|nr:MULTISPECIES: hypothetical protein [unclassified Methylosinus]